MNERLYAFLYLLLEVCNSLLVYKCLLCVSIRKWSIRQLLTGVGLLLVGVAAIYFFQKENLIDLLGGVCIFVITLECTHLSIRQSILLCPLVYIGTAIVNTFGSFVIAWFLGCTQSEIIHSHVWTLVSECTGIVMCLCYDLYAVLSAKSRQERTVVRIDVKKYLLWWIGILGCGFLIAAAQCQEQGILLTPAQIRLIGLSGSAFGVVFLVICMWQGYTNNRKEYIQQENEYYEEYLCMQEHYIHMLMDADKNMRKFRHDFRAHALAIRGHAQDCEDTWLMTYVDEMIGASEMDMHQRYTKIAALDAIIQEMFELAARDGIQVTWKGTLGERVDIRIFDLCTIFSNLLLNAIEACRFVDGTRSIESEVYRYEHSIYIKIRNTIPQKTVIDMVSKKADRKNHGLGVENVRKAVETYHGTLTYTFEEAYGIAEVLLLE